MSFSGSELFSKTIDKINTIYFSYKEKLIGFYYKHEHKICNLIETNYKLGLFHLRSKNLNDAAFRFKLILFFKPKHYKSLYQLARCLYAKEKVDLAKKQLIECRKINPSFEEANYLINIIDKNHRLSNIPISIIEEYYDDFAEYYDEEFTLVNGYRLPIYLAERVFKNISKNVNHSKYTILDLGCGTGQCSYNLKNKISTDSIIGIDISYNMLEKAKKLSTDNSYVYDKLIKADYNKYLDKSKNKYDIIISGLALHFYLNIEDILKKIKYRLNKKGILAISIEKILSNKDASLNYSCENFCYSKKYMQDAIKNAGLKLLEINEYQIKNDRIAFIVICKT